MAAAIANKYVTRNIDQTNGEKAFRSFRISPTSFNITLMIGWFYPGRKPNNGTAIRHQLLPRLSPQANLFLECSWSIGVGRCAHVAMNPLAPAIQVVAAATSQPIMDPRTIGPPDCRTIGLPDYRTLGIPDGRRCLGCGAEKN